MNLPYPPRPDPTPAQDASGDGDTIVAVATADGAAGVGIVRLSGPSAQAIAKVLCPGVRFRARHAHRATFAAADGTAIDDGIALWFPGPRSFTGEDVVELQAHGSPVVLRQLVARCIALGARQARGGEFSARAFGNGRIDLAQAEAIADLIAAHDERAARAARRSLEGEFSRQVEAVGEQLATLRAHVEATIDFADEPLDTFGAQALRDALAKVQAGLAALQAGAERGSRLNDRPHVVIAGPPNAGKSSLLNALSGRDRAIVADLPGTTRDVISDVVAVHGRELVLVDTAGLRDGGDVVEQEGMRRARVEFGRADLVLAVLDARAPDAGLAALAGLLDGLPTLWLLNKSDLCAASATAPPLPPEQTLRVSATTGDGLDALRLALQSELHGRHAEDATGEFSARARHVEAVVRTRAHVAAALDQLEHGALELAAEELAIGHLALGEIVGRVSPDALLGRIFSQFCIGK